MEWNRTFTPLMVACPGVTWCNDYCRKRGRTRVGKPSPYSPFYTLILFPLLFHSPDNTLILCRDNKKIKKWNWVRPKEQNRKKYLLFFVSENAKNSRRRKQDKNGQRGQKKGDKGGGETPTFRTHGPYTTERNVLQARTAHDLRVLYAIFVQHKKTRRLFMQIFHRWRDRQRAGDKPPKGSNTTKNI